VQINKVDADKGATNPFWATKRRANKLMLSIPPISKYQYNNIVFTVGEVTT